jgi:MFS family permease
MDRRYVLAGLSAAAALAAIIMLVVQPTGVTAIIVLVAIYGAMANALYPIAVAHANDFAAPEDFVKVSGGLLLLYGIGTIIGPTLGGSVMTALGPHALFAVTAGAHILITVYAIIRSRIRAAIPADERDNYTTAPAANALLGTPEGLSLDPRASAESSETTDEQRRATV